MQQQYQGEGEQEERRETEEQMAIDGAGEQEEVGHEQNGIAENEGPETEENTTRNDTFLQAQLLIFYILLQCVCEQFQEVVRLQTGSP